MEPLPRPRGAASSAAIYLPALALAALVRWYVAARFYLAPNSDQAVVGLMARHILAGARPTFYWGQPYNGTLEAYLTALLFRLGYRGDGALHVAPILFSLLFVGATMCFCRRLYGDGAALLCGICLACGPAVLLRYSVWPGYSYLQAMGLGTLALALLLPLGEDGGWWRTAPAGLALGLALWAQPLAVVYLPAAAILIAGPAWHAGQTRRWAMIAGLCAGLAGAVVGLLPAILYNLRSNFSTLYFLAGRPDAAHIGVGEATRRMLLWAFPVLLGPIPPSEDPAAFQGYLRAHPASYGAALLALALILSVLPSGRRTLLRWLCSGVTARPAGELALLCLPVALLPAYVLSSWSGSRWSASDPRYLLPLYTLTPLAMRLLLPSLGAGHACIRRHSHLRTLLAGTGLVALLGSGLLANVALTPRPPNARTLAAILEARGVRAIYGDYWDVYAIAYAADERMLPVVIRPNLALAYNRYLPYVRAAAGTRRFAWLLPVHSLVERRLRACLARGHATYSRVRIGELALYDHMSPPTRCGADLPRTQSRTPRGRDDPSTRQ